MKQGRFNLAEDIKIASAIDKLREQKALSAIDGEKLLKHIQAAYDGGSAVSRSWKMGSLYLTEKKLIFFQGQRRLLDIPLDSLKEINLVKRNWLCGKPTKQLCIVQNWKKRERKFYIWLKREEEWKEVINKCLK
ncbi:MAG: hypothetical protein ACE5K3_06510 [bacterium]